MKAYTIEEARRILRIGRNTAYEAARSGAIPTIRIGRRIIVPGVALDRLLGAGTAEPASSVAGISRTAIAISDPSSAHEQNLGRNRKSKPRRPGTEG